MLTRSFYQVRLGANVGKVAESKKRQKKTFPAAGVYRKQLTQQHWICSKLVTCADRIKPLKDHERIAVLHRDLEALNQELPQEFELPLDPKLKLGRIRVEKCKYMDSKKLPLWLVFENADPNGDDYYVIFKSGDDLRQDVLTLQMIRIMDRLWQSEGIDLKLSPYGCIATVRPKTRSLAPPPPPPSSFLLWFLPLLFFSSSFPPSFCQKNPTLYRQTDRQTDRQADRQTGR
jgi:hypothetical protein